jgi:hypothetical protein
MRAATIRALEYRDEAAIIRGMTRGELEAQVLEGDRARASAPPDVSCQLRLTAQAEVDALRQAADAQARHDQAAAASARALAWQLTVEREGLEVGNARYEDWAEDTRARREAVGKARAELQKRGRARPQQEQQAQVAAGPQTMAEWRQQAEADIDAVDRVLARQHQAAIDGGEPWPPLRAPEPDPPAVPRLDPEPSPEDEPAHDNRVAWLDESLARADQAAQRIAADQAGQQASSDYAARIEREAQAGPEAVKHAQARDQAEMER